MTQIEIDKILKLVQASLDTERLIKRWADHVTFGTDLEVSIFNSRLELYRAAEEVWKLVSETDAAQLIKKGSQ